MIRQYKNTKNYSQSSQDSSSIQQSSRSVERQNRVRAIRINEQKNIVHTFERQKSDQSQQDSIIQSSESQTSDLEISQSQNGSIEDMDELEKRIKQLEGSLQRNLKNIPSKQSNKVKRITEGSENSNLINLTQKSPQKSFQKTKYPQKKPNKIFPLKQQSKKIKQSIEQKCKRAVNLRQSRQELANLRIQVSKNNNNTKSTRSLTKQSLKQIKEVKQNKMKQTKTKLINTKRKTKQKQGKIFEIEKQLSLLKILNSLEIKLKASINKKVLKMHQQLGRSNDGK